MSRYQKDKQLTEFLTISINMWPSPCKHRLSVRPSFHLFQINKFISNWLSNVKKSHLCSKWIDLHIITYAEQQKYELVRICLSDSHLPCINSTIRMSLKRANFSNINYLSEKRDWTLSTCVTVANVCPDHLCEWLLHSLNVIRISNTVTVNMSVSKTKFPNLPVPHTNSNKLHVSSSWY